MNILLAGTLTFFVIHTLLWLIRSRYNQIRDNQSRNDQIKEKSKNGGKNA
jgi:hypothetical protein